MKIRIAINGFGRMGKLVLRTLLDQPDFDIVLINEPTGTPESCAHLLEFDTVHGRFEKDISYTDDAMIVEGKEIAFTKGSTPESVDWLNVDVLLDCSGKYRKEEAFEPFLKQGVKKVLVACPVKTPNALNIVYGVNENLYDPKTSQIVTAASCTTNCIAPAIKVIHEKIGIKRGSITTIHDVTNTQVMVDRPHKDLRRARSGLNSLIPTTTGSATAITVIYPELKGKLNGHAVRVPLLTGSITDCVFELEKPMTEEAVNELFIEASKTYLKGILGFESRPLVSSDFVHDPRSTIVDGPSTMIVDGTHLKTYLWYDNEWGYVCRMRDILQMMADQWV